MDRRTFLATGVAAAAFGAEALAQHADHLPPPEGALELWPFPVEIRALGGFAVQVDGASIAMGAGKAQRKPMELLLCLVAGPAEGWAREELADQLWPELDGDRAIPSLRTTIYRLRTALSTPQDPAAEPAGRPAAFDLAIGLVRGPLLPGILPPSLAGLVQE